RGALDHPPRPTADRPVRDALKEWAGPWPTSGYRRWTVMLRRQGHTVNTQRVRRRRPARGICGEAPARRPRTTDSDHPFPRDPNLVEGLEVDRPDPVWAAGITYARVGTESGHLPAQRDVLTR